MKNLWLAVGGSYIFSSNILLKVFADREFLYPIMIVEYGGLLSSLHSPQFNGRIPKVVGPIQVRCVNFT